jgi:hypothetical protein
MTLESSFIVTTRPARANFGPVRGSMGDDLDVAAGVARERLAEVSA